MAARLVLVTGGAGFIGSHLCEGLLKEGYRVRVVDDLSIGLAENIPSGCEFFEGSILDQNLLRQATRGVSAICHEAARVTIRGSIERFYEDAETNLMGTLALLRAAGQNGVARFIYASSMAVYADSVQPVPVAEDHPLLPASPYGIAKLAAERYVLMLGTAFKMRATALRYFNTFGTRQTFTPYVGVITIYVMRLLRKEPITIFGDGNQVRDFVHVSDIVQANLRALKRDEAAGMIFNVGSGRGTSVSALADLLRQKLYSDAAVLHEPARPEELRNSIANISLARQVLGYEPETDLDSQLSEVIEFLRTK